MESLDTLVELITCRPLSQDESNKMTEAIVKVRELMVFAIKEKEKREREVQLPPSWAWTP
jgi:hypothetical protein